MSKVKLLDGKEISTLLCKGVLTFFALSESPRREL